MTTKKQDSSDDKDKSISKHKATRRSVQTSASPQAFDIIPRHQVRPSTTSRPVIPSNKPDVADNTMTTPSQVHLSHQVRIEPGAGLEAETKSQAAILPKESGVSVSDLLAKNNATLTEDTSDGTPNTPAEDVETTTDDKDSESDKKKESETKPAESEPVADAPKEADRPATDTAPVTEAKPDVAKPAAAKSVTDNANDSLAEALKDDTATPSSGHSEVLKDAIKELDDEEVDKDGRHHHDLYGGKPVIVIHKAHGAKAALMWVLWFVLCLGLAVLIVNFLLDADIIKTDYKVPHTNLIKQ